MSVEDSESRCYELNARLSFSEDDLGPSAPELFFFGFFKKFGTFGLKNHAQSKLYLIFIGGYHWNSNFLWKLCVSIGIGLTDILPSSPIHYDGRPTRFMDFDFTPLDRCPLPSTCPENGDIRNAEIGTNQHLGEKPTPAQALPIRRTTLRSTALPRPLAPRRCTRENAAG